MSSVRLSGGKLITDGKITQQDLLICDGKIQTIVDGGEAQSDEYVNIDCTDLYISPGFVDIHQHGGGGSDYMDAAEDTYKNATEAHLAHGCTSVMPTLLSAGTEDTLLAIDAYHKAKQNPSIRANLLGLHVEGRYISPNQAGAQKPENIRSFDKAEYSRIIQAGRGEIRRWSCAPEVDGAKDFAAFASDNDICLSIAHSDADFDTVQNAYGWGFRHITHLYSCMSTITRRGGFRVPGVLEAAYYIDGMNVEIIADGCHLPQALLSYVAKFKDHDCIALITDAMRAAGQNVERSFLGSFSDPLPVIVEDGVAKMEDRKAFAGSVATTDVLVRNMVKAGVSLPDAVAMVTVNPLKMMNLQVKKGRLLPGYDADICVFDDDIAIRNVICKGEICK